MTLAVVAGGDGDKHYGRSARGADDQEPGAERAIEHRRPHTDRHLRVMEIVLLCELPRVAEVQTGDKVPDHQRGHQVGWLVRVPSEAARICTAQNLQDHYKPK